MEFREGRIHSKRVGRATEDEPSCGARLVRSGARKRIHVDVAFDGLLLAQDRGISRRVLSENVELDLRPVPDFVVLDAAGPGFRVTWHRRERGAKLEVHSIAKHT